ncbi:MAG: GTP-binding protein [Candidatus Kariarchaeaceae archaeon]|jgi:small GTP-binding protein
MFWKKKESQPPKDIPTQTDGGQENYFLKLALLGDGAVGKTNLRRNYLGQGFTKDHLMTIGADFAAADKQLHYNDKDYNITYQIWDLAGQASFNQVRSMYYRGVFGALMVFDITRPSSFDNIKGWIEELEKNSGRGKVPMIILGNKYDLVDSADDTVKPEQIDALLAELNATLDSAGFEITYLNTSALTGLNVEEAFNTLGTTILNWLKVGEK